MPRLIDADKLRQRLNPDDWGTPDERWRPEREFGELIDYAPTVDRWHYPSKGDYPKESGDFLCCFYGLTSFKVGWYDKTDQSWCFDSSIIYPKNGADNIIAWQYIVPPKEEA